MKQTLVTRLRFARHFVAVYQPFVTCPLQQTPVTKAIPTNDRTCRLVKQTRQVGQCIILVSEEIFGGYMITAQRSL